MVKKILLGMVATAAVFAFASCKMGAGEGETEGNKWDLTMTVDATDEASNPLADGKVFRRFWKQFSTSEKVAEITTTITIDMSKQTYTSGAFVSGLIFDLNKNADDSKKVDFNLIGVNPMTQKFYVERYVGISKQDAELYDGTEAETDIAIANGTTATPLELASANKSGNWCPLTSSMFDYDDETGIVTCVVKISQSGKKYTVKLGSVKVAEYDASSSKHVDTIDDVEYAVGGIACYGNAGKGNKLVVNYTTEKDSVTGKLEAEEIEE